MSAHRENDGGPDFEGPDAEDRAEQLRRAREKASAPEDAKERAHRIKSKWALHKKQRSDRAAAFAAPFWSARTVLNWIAFRKPQRIDRDLIDEIPLLGNVGWNHFEERRPGDALLKELRSGALTAIEPEGANIHVAKWVHWPGVRLNDHRTWGKISFEREQVLIVFPVGAQAEAEPASATTSVHTDDKPPMATSELRKALLPLLRNLKEAAVREEKPYNEKVARMEAQRETGKKISRFVFRPIFKDAGGGAPLGPKPGRRKQRR